MKIGVIGTGYVGLVTGTCFAEMGHDVFCMDIDQKKIDRLKQGILPIYEPGLEELVRSNQKNGQLIFTADMIETVNHSDLLFIAVGTPLGANGSADLQFVLKAAEQIGEQMNGYRIIVNKSTVPVGTGEKVRNTISSILAKRGASQEFDVVSNPEFLKEGTAVLDFMRPDRIVIGADRERPKEVLKKLYEPFIRNNHPLYIMDITSAEMTKYAANAMLATRISFINEIASLCEKVGADVEQVRLGIGSDSRIGMSFLYPGLGYGGSCLPKDVRALVHLGEENGSKFEMLSAVEQVNKSQRQRLFKQITSHFGTPLEGRQFAVWGLAFKPETDDMREAPSIELIESLLKAGAGVNAYDPVAMAEGRRILGNLPRLNFVEKQYAALEGTDALCLVTEWKSFRAPDFQKMKALMKSPLIFDGRNQYRPEVLAQWGFSYFSVGRPARPL